MAYVVVLILVAIVVAVHIWGPDEEPAKPKSAPAPQQNWVQPPWTEDEEREAIEKINAAVAEFLEDCKRRNRTGCVDLMNRCWRFNVPDAGRHEAYYNLGDQGWVFDLKGSTFSFAVTNTGDWCYASRYIYRRIISGSLVQEKTVNVWRAYESGFERIDPLDLNGYYGKGDEGSCNPRGVLWGAEYAIKQWRTSRPSRSDRYRPPSC